MALPSSGGAGGEKDFVALVAVKVDDATLNAAGTQIRDALQKAVGTVNARGIDQVNESAKKLADSLGRVAEQESRVSRDAATAAQAIGSGAKAADEQAKAIERSAAAFATMGQRAAEVNKNFNLGALGGKLGDNFLSTLLSGGGVSAALSQSLGKLQPALFDIAQGGATATAAFTKLGIEGTGAVSGLTSGMAALGVAALAVVPVIGAIRDGIVGAYEQQKEFVFQSGLLSKQLGTTAEEGAKLRALLTAVGQQDNIFAAITLNQIQASIGAIDRVNRGLEVASPQIEKFGQALQQLGVSYQNQNGSLKTFAELVVDISAGLQNLSTAQRSLAIQNLAGLFGSDVAKIFGLGPEGLTSLLQNAVVVTDEQSKANDRLQISLANLTASQTEFNLALTDGLTPLETFANTVKAGAFEEATDVLGEFFSRFGVVDLSAVEVRGQELGAVLVQGVISGLTFGGVSPGALLFNALFPDETTLKAQAGEIKAFIEKTQESLLIASPGSVRERELQERLLQYESQLSRVRAQLRDISAERLSGFEKLRGTTPLLDIGPSVAIQKQHLSELEKALDAVDEANKNLVDIQKEVIKSNEATAKSFFSQIDAIQKAASAYDSFYEKVGQSAGAIAEIQSGVGKAFSYIGTGTVKDVEKAIVDLRVLEERLGKLDEKQDPGDPRFDQLALNIRRRREALGLQPGELTDISNVDVTVGITGLSKKQMQELNEEFAKLVALKREFLQGGFDVTQSAFSELLSTLTDLPIDQFGDVLTSGASGLQKYAESLGLFASPGFSQAIGEAALKTKLLAGGFGEINTAAGAEAAFAKYLDAFKGFREDLFNLSEFIADPTKLTVPLALEFGLITSTDVALAGQSTSAKGALLEGGAGFGSEIGSQTQAAIEEAAKQKIGTRGKGGGIVNLLLEKYGITPGKAIEATVEFAIDSEADTTLATRNAEATAKKLKAEEDARRIAVKWTLDVTINPGTINTDAVRQQIQRILDSLAPGGVVTPTPVDGINDNGRVPGGGRAAGGDVFRGIPTLVGEEGKAELFIPPVNGRILPGNDTASLMRMFSGRERMPAQPVINYSPVVQQTLNVDARGTNSRDVTQAIKRTQSKGSLFTSSSDIVRNRDFLRSRGLA